MKAQIPGIGEQFTGYVPADRRLLKVSVGASSNNPDVPVLETGEYALVSVSRPIVVFGAWTQVSEAFSASVTATIGDSDGTSRFFDDTTIAPLATGAVLVGSTGLTVPYAYGAAQDLKITIGGASVAAGLVNVYLDYAIVDA